MKELYKPSILASFGLIIVIFGYFSFNAPYMTDNFVFSRYLDPGYASFYTGKDVTASPLTLYSAFRQAYNMYFSWCGRFTGNLAVYLLFLLPDTIYHIISCLAFALYILLIQICVFGRNWREKLDPGCLLALAALVWLSIPSFGEAFLWLSVGGQIALLAQLGMLLPYRQAIQDTGWKAQGPLRSSILASLFFLAGVATSSLDYPTSAALPGTALAATAYIYYRQKAVTRKIPWILLCGALGLLIGGVLTLAAPGNMQRMLLTNDDNVISWLALSWPQRIGLWFLHLPGLVALFPVPLIILLWGLFSIGKAKGKNFYKFIPLSALLFLLPFLLTLGAYLFTAWPPTRAFASCSIQLLICSLIIAQDGLEFGTYPLKRIWRIMRLCLAVCAISTIVWQGFVYYNLHQEVRLRENIIASTKGAELLLPPLKVPVNDYQPLGGALGDISEDAEFWVNRAMALHYGFKKVYKTNRKLEFRTAQGNFTQDISLYLDNDRFFIRTGNASLAKPLEKGAYIYYYGRPALLSRLWTPLANKIYASLAGLRKGDMLLYLVPLLMAQTRLKPMQDDPPGYMGRSPLIRLDDAETVWLVQPGDGKLSFNLIPFRDCARGLSRDEQADG